jgi:hypothetical protein
MIRVGFVTALLGCTATAALAALPNPLADGLRKCAGEADEAKRLSCFDALAATVPKVEADQFGLTADIARKREPATPAPPLVAAAVLPGKIVALRETGNGELIFTLDNKQVWKQAQVEVSKSFAVGESVRIEHGAMGTWWLAADKGRKTRVKRIS